MDIVIKDKSRQVRSYSCVDGGGLDDWIEEWTVEVNGRVVATTRSQEKAKALAATLLDHEFSHLITKS